ncbi:Fe-S cluster assembly protein NifU [Microvirga zambiensis]|uniref:Fe-S cluster assembly protein NifU n=1 Tax=Microvirga zambiensis TaxID=1402137 RepID=UPI001FE2F28E|nr:Fe-S cluster assembly protein NifU [Microvirga zambiensis]
MWDYSDKVKEYFFNPKNAGVLETANAVGEVGAISCGDALKLMISVDPVTETITAATFQTFGRGAAIASSSALTELIIGKTVDEALWITNQDIADFLGGRLPEKMHCSVMGYEALQAAIANYHGEEWGDDHEDGALVCKCFGVNEGVIERAVRINRLSTIEQVTHYTRLAAAASLASKPSRKCLFGSMRRWSPKASLRQNRPIRPAQRMSAPSRTRQGRSRFRSRRSRPVGCGEHCHPKQFSFQRDRKLPAVKDDAAANSADRNRCRGHAFLPAADGGDCELVDVDGEQVYVKLSGACTGCQRASVTINGMRQKLHEATGLALRVLPVS